MFPLIGMKDFLENIREKWFPVAKKSVSTSKNKFFLNKTGSHSQQWRFLLVEKNSQVK